MNLEVVLDFQQGVDVVTEADFVSVLMLQINGRSVDIVPKLSTWHHIHR